MGRGEHTHLNSRDPGANPEPVRMLETQEAHPPKPYGPLKATLAVLVYFTASLVTGVLSGVALCVVAVAQGKNIHDPQTLQLLVMEYNPYIILLSILTGAAALGLYAHFGLPDLGRDPEPTGLKRVGARWLVPAGLAGMLLSAFNVMAMRMAPPSAGFEPGPLSSMASESDVGLLIWVVIAVLLAPVVEEFLFRGVFFTGLARRWGNVVSGIVVSAVFVGLHWGEAGGYPAAIVALSGLALLTLALRIKSESIWPPTACHFCYNSLIATILLMELQAA